MDNIPKLKISLIIPAYNEENYIVDCLEKAIKYSNGKFHEIIVINNKSTDRTKELAQKISGVIVVDEPNKGLTKARQKGLEVATGDLLAYIDADTRIHSSWMKIAENFFIKHPDAVGLSGPYRYYDGSAIKNYFSHLLWWLNVPITYSLVGYVLLGGNFIARKETLLKMGGFDKTIDFYGEDTDIARRLSKFGKVFFRMDFFIYSSSRRYQKEGVIKTNFVYVVNFFWEIFFHRPYTKEYVDHRISGDIETVEVINKKNAEIKAWIFTTVFGLAFLLTWIFDAFDWRKAVPLLIFYIVFLFNTFFTIRYFSNVIPPYNLLHGIIDFILASLYIAIALNIENPPYFIFFTLLVFAVTSVKYTLLLGNVDDFNLLKRKILINVSGVCGCALVIGGILAGYIRSSLWTWAIVFILANIILFVLWPFYRIENK